MEARALVTVICLTFNHEKYIADTLEGFIKQKTDFKYEVLVHDDASTDKTAEIIREYEQRYPEIIRGIYQTENQYSKGIDVKATVLRMHATGKYVALCEGDDYWTDPIKLQMQVEAMEKNQDCKMSVHAVAEVNADGMETGAVFPSSEIESGVITSREFFRIGKEYSFHTSSYMFCAADFWTYVKTPPEFAKRCDVGDELYMLYFGQLGNVYYINRIMSCYRRGVKGSWSATQRGNNIGNASQHHEMMAYVYKVFDQYTNGQYHDIFVERIGRQMALACVFAGTAKELLRKDNAEYYAALTKRQKQFIKLSRVFPVIMRNVYFVHRHYLDKQHGM